MVSKSQRVETRDELIDYLFYPESDGKPMADNTKQFNWIVTIKEGLEAVFKDDPDVFVAGDLLWYPKEGFPETRAAPDAMVVFGRPKGDRGSYRQWREANIAPVVVFEILSPGNTRKEMKAKLVFYEKHEVEEYYEYDPDRLKLRGWTRNGSSLVPIAQMNGWVSPLLKIRFEMGKNGEELKIYRPDGELFATYLQLIEQRQEARQSAEQERQIAQQERQIAEQERQKRLEAEERAERMAARLRELGVEME